MTELLLFVDGLSKEIATAVIMLYKNMKVMVSSSDDDTNFFDIVTGVLQGDTLEPHQFIIYLYYALQSSIDKIKGNGFIVKKDNILLKLRQT